MSMGTISDSAPTRGRLPGRRPRGLAPAVRRHPLVAFFTLAYAVAWAFVPFGTFGAFGPLVAACVVTAVLDGRAGLRGLLARLVRWRVRWYLYALALGVPLAVHLSSAGVGLALGEEGWLPEIPSVTTFLTVLLLRMVNPTDGPLGEEPGWRGFAQERLQRSGWSLLRSTALVAVLVVGWHLPLFLLDESAQTPGAIVGALAGTAAVTFWYGWLFDRARGSLLLVVLAHAVEGSVQADGWVYPAVWCAVAVALLVADRRTWRNRTAAAEACAR
jgi:succinate dehydrogenase hydrophobic anchor subunit